MTITGGCLCKAVRYELKTEAPIGVRQCWCRDCQYLSAGAGTINAIFKKDALSVTGELADFVNIADSGATMHRRFCPKCGTAVFSEAEPRPNLVVVRVGTFDDPNLGRPTGIIWTKSAPNWACFDPALAQTPGQPGPVSA